MKKLLIIFILFLSLISLTGCTKEEPVIIFSSTPFSREHGYTEQSRFKVGDKIYYLIYNPYEFKTRLIKVQVFRKEYDKTGDFFGYDYLYNKTVELNDKKFYTDYFIINKNGYFMFQIFDYTNTLKPIVRGIVRVDN